MSEIDKRAEKTAPTGDGAGHESSPVASPSRRRLIKLGTAAAPVVASLASRPVMAWRCQTVSAWGSEMMNPATSLKTNAGHMSYPNETWTISNWRSNTARAGLGTPWDVLYARFPAIWKASWGNFVFANVPIYKLVNAAGIKCPTGVNPNDTVVSVLQNGTTLAKHTIVAQLNVILLNTTSANDIGSCVSMSELGKMATISPYSPPGLGVNWTSSQVVDYLSKNYIAVPY